MMMNDFWDMSTHNASLQIQKVEGEDAYIKKWEGLTKKVSPLSYRIYSPFIGKDVNILPPDVGRPIIEPILNPGNMVAFYNDKNSLNLLIGSEHTPIVYLRSMNFHFFDGNYNPIDRNNFNNLFDNHVTRIIIKPATDQGGHGIVFFSRKEGDQRFVNNKGEILTIEWLESTYKTDFLIQEAFEQSDYIGQFNPTSVNTIRVNTYRDVYTGEIHYLGGALRIGSKGADVDNASAGGGFVGINANGILMNTVFDKYGNASSVFNGIDFSTSHFEIPNYEAVKQFAIMVSTRFPHMGLFAMDIVLDKHNTPKLIEVNTHSFSEKFKQLTTGPVFGEFTDDVISYCCKNKHKLGISITQNYKYRKFAK